MDRCSGRGFRVVISALSRACSAAAHRRRGFRKSARVAVVAAVLFCGRQELCFVALIGYTLR